MNELIPAWLGVLYGVVVTVLMGSPLAAVVYRDFVRRLKAVEELATQMKHEIYGTMGTNGLRARSKLYGDNLHDTNNWIGRASEKIGVPYVRSPR